MDHLNHLSVKMKTSGYNTPFIRKVMVNGIKTYERKLKNSRLEKSDKNYAPLHLSKSFNSSRRREKKLLAKTSWFRNTSKEAEENAEQESDFEMGVIKVKAGKSKHKNGKHSRRIEGNKT